MDQSAKVAVIAGIKSEAEAEITSMKRRSAARKAAIDEETLSMERSIRTKERSDIASYDL